MKLEQAKRFKALSSDPVFTELVEYVKGEQTKVFIDPSSSPERVEEAHTIIRAFSLLLGGIARATHEVNRGQERNGD